MLQLETRPDMSNPGASSRQVICVTAITAAAVTAAAVLGFQALRRTSRAEHLKQNIEEDLKGLDRTQTTGANNIALGEGPSMSKEWERGEFDEGLIREQLARNYTFLGEDSMKKVRNSYVVIIGCGGVGSWCALMLLRSGISKLLLVDFDLTTLSSLNRHAAATLEDVGTPKVIATKKYLKKIAPWAQVETKVGLWRKGTDCETWLAGADFVVDAIDNITTKVELLTHCHQRGLKVMSSMGAGAKCDPTRIQIADISNTYEDALARNVRRRLRINGIDHGIPVVYSTEIPGEVKLLPLPDDEFEKGKVNELGAFDDFRVRILPVLGPLPSLFGLHIATYILLELAGKSIERPLAIKGRHKTYERLERALMARESKIQMALSGNREPVQTKRIALSQNDIAFIFEDLFQGRSAIPPHTPLSKGNLVRWHKDQPVSISNCVALSDKEADKHDQLVLIDGASPESVWGPEAARRVSKQLREARMVEEWRA